MDDKTTIKEIKNSNIQTHAQLLVDTFTEEPWLEDWTVEIAHNRLLCYQNTPNFIGLSCLKNNELIAFVFGNIEPYQKSSHFLLKEMCVGKEFQGEGIGKKLIEKLHEKLKEEKVGSVILLTQKDSLGEKFYRRSGYVLADSMGLYFKKL